MLDRELKAKWIEALRSGRYQQTRGVLNRIRPSFKDGTPVGMCCLGVLCDIVDPNGWVISGDPNIRAFRNDSATGYLPDDLSEQLGSFEMFLVGRNDSGDSFEEIADYIEKYV